MSSQQDAKETKIKNSDDSEEGKGKLREEEKESVKKGEPELVPLEWRYNGHPGIWS